MECFFNESDPGSILRYHIKNGSGRQRGKWTYGELASALKCSPESIGKWVRNKSPVNRWTADGLANTFGLSGFDKRSFIDSLTYHQKIVLNDIQSIDLQKMLEDLLYKEVVLATRKCPLADKRQFCEYERKIKLHFDRYDISNLKQNSVERLLSPLSEGGPISKDALLQQIKKRNTSCITVGVSPANASSICLLNYLQQEIEYPVLINKETPTSVDIVKDINQGITASSNEAVVLSLGAGINIYKQESEFYVPICVMPGFSVGIATSTTGVDSKELCYHFSTSTVSGSSLTYTDYGEIGTSVDSAPNEAILDSLSKEGVASIVGFPYWNILGKISGTRILNEPRYNVNPSILFVRKDFFEDRLRCHTFLHAIFYAWTRISLHHVFIERQIRRIVDSSYVNNVKKIMGIFR